MTTEIQAPEGGELPHLPMHPEPHSHTWTALEAAAIEQYGRDCARAALAAQPQAPVALTDAQLEHEWRHFNAPVDNPISLFDFECVAIVVQEALGIRAPQTKEQP